MKRGTPDHPKMHMLTAELEKIYAKHRKRGAFGGRAEAIGLLECLWEWASKYAIRGDIGKWSNDAIARGIGWTFSGNELISSLILSRWVDEVSHPFRLVIHDIQDHATNCWRQNLENAGLTWWDGSPPRKYKLQGKSKKSPKIYDFSPQPEPEPEPKPKPIIPPLPPSGVGVSASPNRAVTKAETDRAVTAWFDSEFWPAYPRKVAKGAALKAALRHGRTEERRDEIMAGLKRQAPDLVARGEYCPYPATWLNQKRWEDQPSASTPPTPRSKNAQAVELFMQQVADGEI